MNKQAFIENSQVAVAHGADGTAQRYLAIEHEEGSAVWALWEYDSVHGESMLATYDTEAGARAAYKERTTPPRKKV